MVSVLEDVADLAEAVAAIQSQTYNTVVIERFLSGREFCVAVGEPVVRRDGVWLKLDRPFAFSPIERLLEPGERIFASKDLVPITARRAQLIDPDDATGVRERLLDLAIAFYRAFGLESLVRLDVREDENGRLCLLEANPKPDLNPPSDRSTSLIALGLEEQGMTFDDLVAATLAGLLDRILSGRFGSSHRHVAQLAGLSATLARGATS